MANTLNIMTVYCSFHTDFMEVIGSEMKEECDRCDLEGEKSRKKNSFLATTVVAGKLFTILDFKQIGLNEIGRIASSRS